jgi:Fic family protein
MTLDATRNFVDPLSADRLLGWHAMLFPMGGSSVGIWRDDAGGPSQVGHYEAPAAARIEKEMARFLKWANGSHRTDEVLRAAIAHLGLVTIRPFNDGNGRIARAISDWQLARSENSAQRFYSLSAQMSAERDDYLAMLERTQTGTLDITPWLEWFIGCLGRAFASSETTLAAVFRKARFWERASGLAINDRQRLILNRLLDGYTGILTTQKWATRTKCSHDTALRDIQGLIDQGLLKKDARGGRSTSYSLVEMSS